LELLDDDQRVAFGLLGLTPDEFWRSSPAELRALTVGHAERREETLQLLALHASWICTVTAGKRITPQKLLGRRRTSDLPETLQRDQFEKRWREVEAVRDDPERWH
jgi:hypothetical protein